MAWSGHPRTTGACCLRNYKEAAKWEAVVKPIRGRATECKPVGDRNKPYASIRKEETTNDIVVQLYRTDLVRWKPDGTIIVNQGGYESQTTRKWLNALLPWYFGSFQGTTIVWGISLVNENQPMMHLREDNIFVPVEREGPNYVSFYRFTNPKPCVIHTKNRAKAKEVRARYAPFIRYVKNIKKLMGGNTYIKEKPAPLLHPINSSLLKLALSKDLEDNYKALVHLAYWESWNGHGDALAAFERIITRHHRDEMLEETVLPAGQLKIDKFAGMFR